jgi:hypothetical protein
LNLKCRENHFVNIVKSQESHQPAMNSTIKKISTFVEKLSQSNETQKMKNAAHNKKITRFMKKLKSKVMHGQ